MPPSPPSPAWEVRVLGSLFSRSYEVNLPSSLTEDHPFALAVSCQPTCVGLRYGHVTPSHQRFSCRFGLTYSDLTKASLCPTPHTSTPFSPTSCYEWRPPLSNREATLPLRDPLCTQTVLTWCRTVDLLSIAYASRPRLRPD